MRLYLVQHGEALSKEADPERPLSERGRADVTRIASLLGTAGIRVDTIWHSGKKRAEQTGALLAAIVGAGARPQAVSGIDPLDPTEELARTVNARAEDLMVVGHLPFMARLVARLIVGKEGAFVVAFQPGAIVCLERTEEGSWSIVWMVTPELE